MMKIALFIKSSAMKASISLFLFIYIVVQPSHAYAGFFSDLLTKVLGSETQASEVAPIIEENVTHNSQNVPLLESSINPDTKSIKDDLPLPKSDDDILLSSDGSLGIDSELEKYSSTEKITTYTVKRGDTLLGISNRLKVPQSTILASNADLKKTDLLKIGQKLVIIAINDPSAGSKVVVKEEKPKTTVKEPIAKKEEPKVTKVAPTVSVNVEATPTPLAKVEVQAPQVVAETPKVEVQTPSGKPSGDIKGGYIWPFPAGVGRISQGRHADNAFDFAAPKGTPIYAVYDGTVLIAHHTGYNGGYGLYVVINFDDGRQAIFGHMSKVAVDEGQVVKQGDVIGYVGNTGKSTGPHVHAGFHGSLSNPYMGLKVNSTSDDFHD